MIIENGKVVSIEYTLKDSSGETLDTTEGSGPLDYIHGMQNLIPGLEKELAGKSVGDAFSVEVQPKDAYGEYVDDLVMEIPRSNFPPDVEIEPGMQFTADGATGSPTVTVVEINGDKIKIDANHPLAGEKLFFDIKVTDIREATDEKLKYGLYNLGGGCGGCGGCGSGGCGPQGGGCSACAGGCPGAMQDFEE